MQNDIDYIFNKFKLTIDQSNKFLKIKEIYSDWNAKINLISRKDFVNIYIHHVLHSLSIAKIIEFKSNTKIIDVGTGGGFPGIPLAIMFPDVSFYLIDSMHKKIKAVKEICRILEIENVTVKCIRSEEFNPNFKFDFILGRAVTQVSNFYDRSRHLISDSFHNKIKNGILYLTGDVFLSKEAVTPAVDLLVADKKQISHKDVVLINKKKKIKCRCFQIEKIFPEYTFFKNKVLVHCIN